MLEYLHIRNLALIDDMALEFTEGINVLTGETGAGKSFILKALGFALGDKLTPDIVRPGADKARVEALFSLPGEDLTLRRELAAGSGRSRFFINDTLSSQEALRELRPRLLSHTSQHAQQRLLQPVWQAKLLEKDFPEPELLQKRDNILAKLKEIEAEIAATGAKQSHLAEKRELLEMQKAEIDKVAPRQGEEEELEEMRASIRAEENSRENYGKAMLLLHGDDGPGILQLMAEFERLLKQMSREDPALEKELQGIEALGQQLSHISGLLRRPPSRAKKINVDEIEERLFAFAQLKRKLKRTLPQILELGREINENLSFLDVCALDLSRLSREKEKLQNELKDIVSLISPLRRKTAQNFAMALEEQLRDLGFSEHVRVIPDFVPQEIWPGIQDERGRIFWAPNPGQNPQPLDKIASGGELSRFLLGLSTLDDANRDATYIFDEVDAGVGGITLNKLGQKLLDFSRLRQIILITHWPRLAASARKHFQISKVINDGKTFTLCAPLEGRERAAEIARMAGGGSEGKALAENLLAQS